MSNLHIWGQTTYVLDPKLDRYGVTITKWPPRIRQVVNTGFSRTKSSLLVFIIHLMTGSFSPQFNVIYNDLFTTVHRNE